MLTREEYEAKVTGRIERLRARAAARADEATALDASARRMADVIPLGQPILVGHHSEGRDRRYRERIRRTWDRAMERRHEAERLERRAAAAEDNGAISSDNPDAPELLRAQVAELEREQERDKRINAIVRSYRRALAKPHDVGALRSAHVARLAELGIKPDGRLARDLLDEPDFAGRFGIPDYVSRNRGANIRRIRERIAYLERQRATEHERTTETIGDVELDEEDNRVRLRFPGKPSRIVIDALRGAGFRWAPSVGRWQRHASPSAWHSARSIARLTVLATSAAQVTP